MLCLSYRLFFLIFIAAFFTSLPGLHGAVLDAEYNKPESIKEFYYDYRGKVTRRVAANILSSTIGFGTGSYINGKSAQGTAFLMTDLLATSAIVSGIALILNNLGHDYGYEPVYYADYTNYNGYDEYQYLEYDYPMCGGNYEDDNNKAAAGAVLLITGLSLRTISKILQVAFNWKYFNNWKQMALANVDIKLKSTKGGLSLGFTRTF